MPDSEKQPPGGHDATPLHPSSSTTYTVRIVFHAAQNIPVADINTASSDPYVLAQLDTERPTRHSQDPRLRFRTITKRRTTEPKWNAQWVVAGVPASGLTLKARLYDEDPGNHDDRLGKVVISTGAINESWKGINEEWFKVSSSGTDLRAYGLRWCTSALRPNRKLHARMSISVQVLGKTKEEVGKVYTTNTFWRVHYAPMIGRIAGTRNDDGKGVERYDFQANELQLQGPVPNEMYHRYVEFKNFVGGMFEGTGLQGKVLHKALHHQHNQIYNFDSKTKHGELEGPGEDMTLQFLDMVHFDQGGRIFTYVITLDGLFRFTETGKEFGIDLLSKHTMHSDVNIYIAWSGEFLVRRLKHPEKDAEDPDQETHPNNDVPGGPPNDAPPKNPSHYELIIDNDSGTYRPDEKFLPILRKFLEKNLPGLQILAKSCTDKELDKIKKEQKETKHKEGDTLVFNQNSRSGSISSSDEEDLADRAGGKHNTSALERGVAMVENPKGTLKNAFTSQGKADRENAETLSDERANAIDGKAGERNAGEDRSPTEAGKQE